MKNNVVCNLLKIGRGSIKYVTEVKYIVLKLTSNSLNSSDVIKRINEFYDNFNSIPRKFNNIFHFLVFLNLIVVKFMELSSGLELTDV